MCPREKKSRCATTLPCFCSSDKMKCDKNTILKRITYAFIERIILSVFYYFQDFPQLFLCVEDQFCGGVTASQWHQPSKGQYNEEKNEAHCSQKEESFFTYMTRITE